MEKPTTPPDAKIRIPSLKLPENSDYIIEFNWPKEKCPKLRNVEIQLLLGNYILKLYL